MSNEQDKYEQRRTNLHRRQLQSDITTEDISNNIRWSDSHTRKVLRGHRKQEPVLNAIAKYLEQHTSIKPLTLPGETWKPIPGWEESYSVSDKGRVRGEERIVQSDDGREIPYMQRILNQPCQGHGYPTVGLSRKSKTIMVKVHQVVARVFIGPCPEGMTVDHINNDKTDNRVENLEYVTREENISRAHNDGMINNYGENNEQSILANEDIHDIRERAANGEYASEIAGDYPVKPSTVHGIISLRAWRSVHTPYDDELLRRYR